MTKKNQNIDEWNQVSIRIFTKTIPPDQITMHLGIESTNSALKGSHYQNNPKYGKHKYHYWSLDVTKNASIPFDIQISKKLQKIWIARSKFKSLLRKTGTIGDIFLGYSTVFGTGKGGTLSLKTLKLFVAFGLKLTLDLFPKNIYEIKELSRYKKWIIEGLHGNLKIWTLSSPKTVHESSRLLKWIPLL